MIMTKIKPRKISCLYAGAAIALVCATASLSASIAFAQETSGQQLPANVVEQQIPQNFPAEDSPQQARRPAAAQPASILDTKSDQGADVKEAPAAANPPQQPEARKLVPATPMGQEAKGVQDPVAAPATQETSSDLPEAPAMPDVLEKYTAKSSEAKQAAQQQDALPQLDDATKMQLQANALTSGTSGVVDDGVSAQVKTDEQLQEEIRTEAFDAAITGIFPLQPGQVRDLLKTYDKTQEAVETPVYDAPKPEISVQNISLDPGVMPPVIKTAVGNVTTLNILDATGAPWPVQDVTWAGDYEIVEPEEGGHIIRITPMNHYARGNIVIRLLTLKTPLTMTLETGRDIVQYRVDARVPEYGPYANAPIMQGGKSTLVAGSSELTSVLDGASTGEMVKLEVSGVDGRTTAYMKDGITYVRTPLTLLSPAWQSSVSSADGMNVYSLTNAPVLLLSDGGEFMRAVLKEKKDLLDE